MFPVRSVTYVPGLYPLVRSPPPLTGSVMRTVKWNLEEHMKLKRVPLIVALAAGCLAAPLAAGAQQQVGKLSHIGVLMNLYPPDAHPPQALRQRLRDLRYVEGQNLVIDWRYQLGGSDRLAALAAELEIGR